MVGMWRRGIFKDAEVGKVELEVPAFTLREPDRHRVSAQVDSRDERKAGLITGFPNTCLKTNEIHNKVDPYF